LPAIAAAVLAVAASRSALAGPRCGSRCHDRFLPLVLIGAGAAAGKLCGPLPLKSEFWFFFALVRNLFRFGLP